jgi:hypothetical protein
MVVQPNMIYTYQTTDKEREMSNLRNKFVVLAIALLALVFTVAPMQTAEAQDVRYEGIDCRISKWTYEVIVSATMRIENGQIAEIYGAQAQIAGLHLGVSLQNAWATPAIGQQDGQNIIGYLQGGGDLVTTVPGVGVVSTEPVSCEVARWV